MKFFLGLLLALCVGFAVADTIEGKVVGVTDGDTVTLLVDQKTEIKIRLAEIDAPESHQAFGAQSKKSLSDLVFGKAVQIQDSGKRHRGRIIGYVLITSLDVNKEQVRRGMAWAYRKYMKDTDYLALEEQAKASRVGLWVDVDPVPPWEFRHSKKR